MSGDPKTVLEDEMLPLLDTLCTVTAEEGNEDQSAYFERIRSGLQRGGQQPHAAIAGIHLGVGAR